jgi:hypothetical protein
MMPLRALIGNHSVYRSAQQKIVAFTSGLYEGEH